MNKTKKQNKINNIKTKYKTIFNMIIIIVIIISISITKLYYIYIWQNERQWVEVNPGKLISPLTPPNHPTQCFPSFDTGYIYQLFWFSNHSPKTLWVIYTNRFYFIFFQRHLIFLRDASSNYAFLSHASSK